MGSAPMPTVPRLLAFALAVSSLLLAACSRPKPDERAAALAQEIVRIRAELPPDPTADQADAVAKPAKRAAKAYADLIALADANPQNAAIAAARAQAEPAYIESRHIQRLATERHALAKLMGGLKVRGYRTARTIVVPKLLTTLAAAARQAAEVDPAKLPPLVRGTAELAAELTGLHLASPDSAEPAPGLNRDDWLRIAERIDSYNNHEPPEFALGLGLAYGVFGENGLALVELERAAAGTFADPRYASIVPLATATIYSRLGFTELAAREASKISGDTETGRQLIAVIHAALAYCHATEKDWRQMDTELALAVRAWPDNPLVIYLSGERLLADGRKEQAMETFARATSGTDAAWLAPLIEGRLREVRDAKGTVPPLLLDNGFLARCALHTALQQARQTEAGRKLATIIEAAQHLPERLGATPPQDNPAQ